MSQKTNDSKLLNFGAILILLLVGVSGLIITLLVIGLLLGFYDVIEDFYYDWDIVDTFLAFVIFTICLVIYKLNNNLKELKKYVEENLNEQDHIVKEQE